MVFFNKKKNIDNKTTESNAYQANSNSEDNKDNNNFNINNSIKNDRTQLENDNINDKEIEDILSSSFALNSSNNKNLNETNSEIIKTIKIDKNENKTKSHHFKKLKSIISKPFIKLGKTSFIQDLKEIFNKLLGPFFKAFYKLGYLLGIFIIRGCEKIWYSFNHIIIAILKGFVALLTTIIVKPIISLLLYGKKFIFDFVDPFSDAASVTATAYEVIKNHKQNDGDNSSKNEDNIKQNIKICLKSYFKCFCNILNHIAPIAAVIALVFVVGRTSKLTFALEVSYNGESLGFIENELTFEEAEKMVQSRVVFENIKSDNESADSTQSKQLEQAMAKTDDNIITDLSYIKNISQTETLASEQTENKISKANASYSLKVIDKEEVENADSLCDKLIKNLSDVIVEASGFYVDGVFYGATENSDYVDNLLKEKIAAHDDGTGTVSFYEPVELTNGLYPKDVVLSDKEFETLLNSTVSGKKEYIIQAGDAPLSIASKNNIPYSDLKALNPNIETDCMPGDVVLISKEQQFLQVMVTKQITYTRSVAFETEETKTDKQYVGYSKVTQNGVDGEDEIIANVSYLDGVEVDREIVQTTRTLEPVNKKVLKGTKQMTVPTQTGSTVTINSNYKGGFSWPTVGGKMTCGWLGYYRHYGVDICNSYGTPVLASAPGVVTYAGWNSWGYGNLVKIDHGNGYVTLYAHNSRINVSVGQTVAQGQQIANMGQTGNAYGNHVHFEIHYNGTAINPEPFLGLR